MEKTQYWCVRVHTGAHSQLGPAPSSGIDEGSVVLTGINEKAAAEGTLAALKATVEKLKSGEVKVFDTKNFTVEGAAVTGDNVVNGIFEESKTQSAPYFELKIDGITRLNEKF